MSGSRINNAKKALSLFLHSLPVDTNFNVISFGSQHFSMFPASARYTNESLTQALK